MIVFDLRCAGGHVFEAWFGSSDSWEQQRAAGLVECPICGVRDVAKAVMAPNIAAKSSQRRAPVPGEAPSAPSAPAPTPDEIKAAIQTLAAAQARALEGSQWVGTGFAERARAMHEGREEARTIHGQASIAEARALHEEGVPVVPLPFPVVPPEARN